ncbi:histidine phosphatase family protein [Nitrosococcus wardiae]|uniref:Histidine phosphatase family protein n=1 Tax=Nitrosococcus wardiae TaxID=1814290 RepID=A0A4V1AW83_9GAMM|nr:histidine phosphatase family protein [Nitrosococcus wardiae]QBQ55735.1 histidine phosphatase family protein [Nitrosococcus wardiae]
MTLFLCVRHGETNVLGRVLTGREPGVHLNAQGWRQARQLAERLRNVPLQALCTSPLERAQETAQPLADECGLNTRIVPEINEIDYGDWQGYSIEELAANPYWTEYNRYRGLYRVPGGESLAEVQLRMAQGLERLRGEYPEGSVVLISHSDPLKTLFAYLLGIPLDFITRFEIDPASISAVEIGTSTPRVLCLNHRDNLSFLRHGEK